MPTVPRPAGITPTADPCPGFVTSLVLRCGHGDEVAFGLLFDLFHRLVFAEVGSRVPDGRQEELVITAFANMWRYASTHPPGVRGAVAWVMDHAREVADEAAPTAGRASLSGGAAGSQVDGLRSVVL